MAVDTMACRPMLDSSGIGRLRDALERVGYRPAQADPGNERFAAMRDLFELGHAVPEQTAAAALAPLPVTDALEAGLLERCQEGVRATVLLVPYGRWWLISDLPISRRPRPVPADFVLGAGGASDMLAQATIRRPVGRALDVCTGGGVQSLHLSEHAESITGTDLSPRALRYAATTAALNGLDWDLRLGDMTEPVTGQTFDLIVANPPFILKPGGSTYLYRDSGREGDAVSSDLIRAGAGLLAEGGHLQMLAGWAHHTGQPWTERVASWAKATGCDAWAVEYGRHTPDAYVQMWTSGTDATEHEKQDWVAWFRANQVESIGWGWITLRNAGHRDPAVRTEELWGQQVRPNHVLDLFARQDWLRTHPDLLAATYTAAEGAVLQTQATLQVGGQGWKTDQYRLTASAGPTRTAQVSQLIATVTASCDGTTPLHEQLIRLAQQHNSDTTKLLAAVAPALPRLIERGYLQPTDLHR